VSAIFISENLVRVRFILRSTSVHINTHTRTFIHIYNFIPFRFIGLYNCIVLRANTGNSVSPYYPRDRIRNRCVLFIRVHNSRIIVCWDVHRRLIVVVFSYRVMRKETKRKPGIAYKRLLYDVAYHSRNDAKTENDRRLTDAPRFRAGHFSFDDFS